MKLLDRWFTWLDDGDDTSDDEADTSDDDDEDEDTVNKEISCDKQMDCETESPKARIMHPVHGIGTGATAEQLSTPAHLKKPRCQLCTRPIGSSLCKCNMSSQVHLTTTEEQKLQAENKQLRHESEKLKSQLCSAEERIVSLQFVAGDCVTALQELKTCQTALAEARNHLAAAVANENSIASQVRGLENEIADLRAQLLDYSTAAPSMTSQYSVSSTSSTVSSLGDFAWMESSPPARFGMPPTVSMMMPHDQQYGMPVKIRSSPQKLMPSQQLDGTVERVEEYGVFVRVDSGQRGMVHVSCLNSRTYVQSAKDLFSVGQRVTTWMAGYKKGKLRLTMISPWESASRVNSSIV